MSHDVCLHVSKEYLEKLLKMVSLLAREDIYVRIVMALAKSKQEYLSLRGLAREVNMAPKNVKKYVQKLAELGIVKVEQPHEKMLLIRLNDEYKWLREIVPQYELTAVQTAS